MSTPRRSWPKSSGTPMMRSLRCIPGQHSPRPDRLPNAAFRLRLNAVDGARKGNGFAHVLQAADPAHHPLDPHPETTVGHRAEAPQVQVPLDGPGGELVFLDALHQQVHVVDALAAADDLAVALRR